MTLSSNLEAPLINFKVPSFSLETLSFKLMTPSFNLRTLSINNFIIQHHSTNSSFNKFIIRQLHNSNWSMKTPSFNLQIRHSTVIQPWCNRHATKCHATRSSDSLVLFIPYVRSSLGKRASSVIGPRLWNSLPPDTRNSNSLPIFRSKLKTHLFKIAFPP